MNYTSKKNKQDSLIAVNPSMFIREMQSLKKQMVHSAEKNEQRKKTVDSALAGFNIDDLSKLYKGELIHHTTMGRGLVVSNRGNILTVRFRTGIKMFTY